MAERCQIIIDGVTFEARITSSDYFGDGEHWASVEYDDPNWEENDNK